VAASCRRSWRGAWRARQRFPRLLRTLCWRTCKWVTPQLYVWCVFACHLHVLSGKQLTRGAQNLASREAGEQAPFSACSLIVQAKYPIFRTNLVSRAFAVARCAHEGQLRRSGDPYLMHAVETAKILADLGLDEETVAAGGWRGFLEGPPHQCGLCFGGSRFFFAEVSEFHDIFLW
jgi:HD domain